jgi:hypothetical protein
MYSYSMVAWRYYRLENLPAVEDKAAGAPDARPKLAIAHEVVRMAQSGDKLAPFIGASTIDVASGVGDTKADA